MCLYEARSMAFYRTVWYSTISGQDDSNVFLMNGELNASSIKNPKSALAELVRLRSCPTCGGVIVLAYGS